MQNLQLPKIPVQDLFYLRQLTLNAFQIHNMKSGEGMFYLYHEGEAYKGPNEVCSFLLMYLENIKKVEPNIKEVRLFCDNCSGQNKNNVVIRFCQALVDTGMFKKVEIFYPIRGHSFLDNDRDFGVFKRKLAKVDRIYSIREYMELIVKSGKKFKVTLITHEDIIHFKEWHHKYYKKNLNSIESASLPRSEKISFKVSQFHHYIFEKGHVTCSREINSLVLHCFSLLLPNSDLNNVQFPTNSYTKKIPISSAKIADIKKSASYVPDGAQGFYKKIFKWPTKD